MNKKEFEEIKRMLDKHIYDARPSRYNQELKISEKGFDELWNWIQQYAKDMCKEQREKIEKEYNVGKYYEPYFGWCNVEGCENEGCSGGNAWRETGYWTVCYKHADDFRNGKPQPKMQQKYIDKEKSRDPKTGYLPPEPKELTKTNKSYGGLNEVPQK